MLRTGSDWLAGQFAEHATETVTYRRGALSAQVRLRLGGRRDRVAEVDGGYGWERVESRDFLIPVEDLVLGGQAAEPAAGDRIEQTIGGAAEKYDVLAPGQEKCWRYSDPWKKTFRVHTKHVGGGS